MITRHEWTGHRARARAALETGRAPPPALQQAAVAAQQLTADPKWNLLLAYLQGAIDRSQEALVALQRQTLAPVSRAERDVMIEEAIRIQARIEAWRTVMSLPKTLIETGELPDAADSQEAA